MCTVAVEAPPESVDAPTEQLSLAPGTKPTNRLVALLLESTEVAETLKSGSPYVLLARDAKLIACDLRITVSAKFAEILLSATDVAASVTVPGSVLPIAARLAAWSMVALLESLELQLTSTGANASSLELGAPKPAAAK